MDNRRPLILDNGTATTKAGFAFDDHPRAIFSSVIGRPKYLGGQIGREYYEVFIGDEAELHCEELDLVRPLKEGRVVNWDDMERLWHHMFYRELRIAPEDGPILMSCVPLCPLRDKEIICEIMFETLNIPSLFIESQSVLALYASGRTNGVVIDSGFGVTNIVPMYEGNVIKCGHIRHHIAGEQISSQLQQMLNEKGCSFTNSWSDLKIIDDIKKKCCYVCKDFSCPIDNKEYVKEYELPDGKVVKIGEESHFCTEPLFQPHLMGYDHSSLPQEINMSVIKCDADIRESLLANLVVCGGNTLFPNFAERLREETQQVVGDGCAAKVTAPEERLVSPWLGGSLVAALPDSTRYWLQRRHYEEHGGDRIVKTKFI